VDVAIHTPFITLDQCLKWAGVVDTGGGAKAMIATGEVLANGESETRRGRKLYPGDKVTLPDGQELIITRGEG
jgi:S4 domain protein YaaA